jgi:putative endonuclease
MGGHYTRAHGARRIVYTEAHRDRSSASKREASIKCLSREEKVRLIAIHR